MRRCPQGQGRSVDRGTCRPGIEPRKNLPPGRRRCKEKRKATLGASISRDASRPRAVRDPVHVRKHLAREPGDPVFARSGWRCGPCREVQGQTPMMNGHGKSDRPVVPAKSPNNGNAPRRDTLHVEAIPAEGVEGRGLAKGNPPQQNRSRTPCRAKETDMANPTRARSGKPRKQPRECAYLRSGGLHSALERIRHAARSDSVSLAPHGRHHLRQEPSAVIPLAGICAGGPRQPGFLPRLG